jgi:hypothetical protein
VFDVRRPWVWEHWDDRGGVVQDGAFFATAAEAQQAAMAYAREFQTAQREEAELEADEARYGTYEQQVRDTYYANCM